MRSLLLSVGIVFACFSAAGFVRGAEWGHTVCGMIALNIAVVCVAGFAVADAVENLREDLRRRVGQRVAQQQPAQPRQ